MTDSFEEMLRKSKELPDMKADKAAREDDPTFWYPKVGKDGTASFLIRLLPPPKGEENAVVQLFEYAWKNPVTGRYYIENSRATLGRGHKDPMSEYTSEMYKLGKHDSSRNRRERYICNVYIMKDPQNPENEGKVFRWKFAKQVWDIIESASKSAFEESDTIKPFHFIEGAPFELQIYLKETVLPNGETKAYPQYDKSRFLTKRPFLSGDMDKLKEVWQMEHPLKPLVSEGTAIKSYDDLKKQLRWVLGEDTEGAKAVDTIERRDTIEKVINQSLVDAGVVPQFDDEVPVTKVKAPTAITADPEIEAMLEELSRMK